MAKNKIYAINVEYTYINIPPYLKDKECLERPSFWLHL